MENFFDYYYLHKSSKEIGNQYVSLAKDKTCRFCQRSFPDVTFKSIPHILPELFGRNNLTSNFECDSCNKKFQKLETDAATMIQHYITLMGLKTKKKIPLFQSLKSKETKSTTLQCLENQRFFNFGINLFDFEKDEDKKKLTVYFRTKKFRPFHVYKLFLKIGISLLSEAELEENKHFLELLNSDYPIVNGMQNFYLYRYILKQNIFRLHMLVYTRQSKLLMIKLSFLNMFLLFNLQILSFNYSYL